MSESNSILVALSDPSQYALGATLLTVFVLLPIAFVAVFTWWAGRRVIPQLVRLKINDGEPRKASDYLNMLSSDKKNTPTMGGVFLIPSIIIGFVVWFGFVCGLTILPREFGWWKDSGMLDANTMLWMPLVAIGTMLAFAALGLWDDYCKLTKRGKDGISSKFKFAMQTVIAVVACSLVCWLMPEESRYLNLLFARIDIGWMIVPIGAFVMVGSSNAYNLTDGLDGLASKTGIFAFLALGVATYFTLTSGEILFRHESQMLPAMFLAASAAGGLIGFLIWNRHPAKVFMGDTGSLSLGALLGLIAVMARLEIVLAVVGAVFVVEALSVMLQVGYFKLSGGKRIFLCAPLHHHFQFKGQHETKVTNKFALAGALCAVLGVMSVFVPSWVQTDDSPTNQPITETADQPTVDHDAVVYGGEGK